MSFPLMDFRGLNAHLLNNNILADLLPGGTVVNGEYTCGSTAGGAGRSCRTNVKTGIGSDFATGDTWGDVVALYSLINNVKPSEAYKTLSQKYNYKTSSKPASKPAFHHYRHGNPSEVWEYKYPDGKTYVNIARYDLPDGKQICPWLPDGKCKMPAEPRLLFNLPEINKYPDRPILIVEGEPSAVAAQKLVGDSYVCTTWIGGTNAVKKSDWSLLSGRHVLIWPDADTLCYPNTTKIKPYEEQPGPMAAVNIAEILYPICPEVKIINVGMDTSRKSGWDAADALSSGWTLDDLVAWAKPRVVVVTAPKTNTLIQPTEPIDEQLALDDQPALNLPSVGSQLTLNTLKNFSRQVIWEELGLSLTSQSNPIDNMDNVMRILEAIPDLSTGVWFDDFHQKIFTTFRAGDRPYVPISDSLEYELTIFIQRYIGLNRVTDKTVSKAIAAFARRNTRNEPRDWLKSLKWDGVPRINKLFITYAGSPNNEYTQSVSRNFILSIVARIMRPGCKADCMAILEGKQGKRKSTFLKSIIGEEWHTESIESFDSNNFYQALNGKVLVEFADLSRWSKADINKLKQMVSNQKDTYRAPYDRHADDHRRSSVFAGTTNDHVYLEDDTGARRYWPIETNEFDINGVRDDRDQLFAEGVNIYQSETPKYDDQRVKSTWWEVPESAAEEQDLRRIQDPWEYDINEFVKFKKQVTIQEILTDCLRIESARRSRSDLIRVGKILSYRNFVKRRKSGENREYFYERLYHEIDISDEQKMPDFEE